MTDKIARVCDYCGKHDILEWHGDSNNMVIFSGDDRGSFLLMIDIPKGRSGRPTFSLEDKAWHPDCLRRAIDEWLDNPYMKAVSNERK